MSARRQQRAARDRRSLSLALQPILPLASIATAVITGPHVLQLSLGMQPQPPDGTASSVDFVLAGIPKVLRVTGGAWPISATWDSELQAIDLTYGGANLAACETFLVGPRDPAIISRSGMELAPAQLAAEA